MSLHELEPGSLRCMKCGLDVGGLPLHDQCYATEGRKDDAGKPPYHLIAPELLSAIAEILEFGAKKYAPRNWEKGMAWHRPFRACIGHMWDWWRGAGPDAETGKSHLWHAACCIMFLIAYEARGIGEDDRPQG